MIDKLSIDNKLGDLIKNVSILEGLKNISIQIVIDIGNHILAELKESRIEEYADVIDKLGERQIIPEDFARRIRGITGLRNLLVHEYGVIRIEKIYDMLQNNLSDFTEFHDYIQSYITE